MNAKQAAQIAKRYISDLMSDEGIQDVGLEEVDFESAENCWKITIGFTRPWDRKRVLVTALGDRYAARVYKVIRINDGSGEVLSVKDRMLPASK